jgi:hypothetical protein
LSAMHVRGGRGGDPAHYTQVLPLAAALAAEIVSSTTAHDSHSPVLALLPRCVKGWGDARLLRRAHEAIVRNKFAGPDGVARLYLVKSFFNHSCEPNASPDLLDPGGAVLAIAPIQAGEEVTISYFGLQRLQQEHRQELLGQHFGFRCGCALCRRGGGGGVLGRDELQKRLAVLIEMDP